MKIEEVVDQYVISHKGNLQCKCISGARGHLIAKLKELFEQEKRKWELEHANNHD